jgi:hypothetical protein
VLFGKLKVDFQLNLMMQGCGRKDKWMAKHLPKTNFNRYVTFLAIKTFNIRKKNEIYGQRAE